MDTACRVRVISTKGRDIECHDLMNLGNLLQVNAKFILLFLFL